MDFDFIERLQNKPRFIRVQILWISVILIMLVIVWIWLLNLSSSLKSPAITTSEEEQTIPSLFTVFKQDFLMLKKGLQAQLREITAPTEGGTKFEVEIIKPNKLPE